MPYYRIKCADSMPLYAQAKSAAEALKRIEAITGSLPRDLVKVKEIQQDDIPEGENVF